MRYRISTRGSNSAITSGTIPPRWNGTSAPCSHAIANATRGRNNENTRNHNGKLCRINSSLMQKRLQAAEGDCTRYFAAENTIAAFAVSCAFTVTCAVFSPIFSWTNPSV